MNNEGLSIKQEQAIELMMGGMTDGEIAEEVGVGRQTVSKWRNQDADFRAALALRRELVRERHMEALGELVEKAIAVVKEALESPDEKTRLKTAMFVLKVSGLQGYAKPGKAKTRGEIEKEGFLTALEESIREMGMDL